LSNGDLRAGDDRTSEGGSEKVHVFVDGVAGNGWIAKLLDEL
jgi:hypothetical protein